MNITGPDSSLLFGALVVLVVFVIAFLAFKLVYYKLKWYVGYTLGRMRYRPKPPSYALRADVEDESPLVE